MVRALLAGMLTLLMAGQSSACMMEDSPSRERWIWLTKLIFVGTVVERKPLAECASLPQDRPDNVCVVIRVDDDIRGGLDGLHEVEEYTVPQTSCDRSGRFAVGERWLLLDDYNGPPSENITALSAEDVARKVAEVRAVIAGPEPAE